ncbi:MAG: hypothetical protein CL557_12420 [Alphaproteobacteria bacterium]|nr:hypothetical protein [Alphaproteobacteria bacterium]|tara:strand:+ start:17409 stop:17768 length:360 start_codon:yes stop_codon:yes gene_type:complete
MPLYFLEINMAEQKTTKKRARTKSGHYRADDPSTPDVDEAWEGVLPDTKETEKKTAWSGDDHIWYESKNKEPSMFEVAGISPIRNFANGTLEYKVHKDDITRFEKNHFVMNARIVKKRV